MADILVTSPFQPFTLPTQFKAVFNGYIYCGTVDAVDPSVSQVQVYLVNESGDKVPVAQPLRTNAGGFPVYNGQPATFVTNVVHSILIQDQYHNQLWYEPDVSLLIPQSGFIQSGDGAAPRTAQDKMRETVSAPDFGALTSEPDNSAAFSAAQVESEVVQVPRGSFDIGTTPPDFNISGGGKLVASGVETSAKEVSYNPEFEIFAHTPKDYKREHLGVTYPPPPFATEPGTQKHYRTVHSLGSQLGDKDKLAAYVTAFGNFNGANFNQWFAVDAFGGDTLMYAYNVERTVAVGSESLAWFGAPNSQYLIDFKHDWWRQPSSNPYLPGDPLWNFNGLADIHPGLSAEIAAYTDYAVTTAGAGNFTTLGRNAGNHTVKGTNCLFAGYAAGQDFYAGNNCVGLGPLSLRSIIFGTNLTAVGRESGMVCKDSVDAGFFGHGSGRTIKKASRSLYLGTRTGDGCEQGEGAVLLGYQAGKGFANLDDLFILCNDGNNKQALLSGSFATNNAGVGLNPDKVRARWHVRFADSGSTITPGNGALIEGASLASVTVETANNGFGSYRFADPQSNYVGGMEYGHASDSLNFFSAGASRVRISATGELHPTITDNTQSLGKAANRWSVVYAGTGAINTSDAREKTAPLAITDSVLDAWGDVQLITFQWLESIAQKGEDTARWHFGVIAQQVRDAFAARGIDGTRYGLLCYDEWEDEYVKVQTNEGEKVTKTRIVQRPAMTSVSREVLVDKVLDDGSKIKVAQTVETLVPKQEQIYVYLANGEPRLKDDGTREFTFEAVMEDVEEEYQEDAPPEYVEVLETAAGNRWGIRPDQCLFLEAAYQRRRCDRIEARLSKAGL